MDRPPPGRGDPTADPLPYVRGLFRLIPESRLAAILSRTERSSERRRCLPADSVIWLVIAMALYAADSIPKVWRRLHPTRDLPEPTDSAFSQARRRLGAAPLRHLFRTSFIDSLRVLRCQLPESPSAEAEAWYQRLLREVRRQVLRPRRDRWYARVIKRTMSNWMKKRPEHRNPPQPTKACRESVVILV